VSVTPLLGIPRAHTNRLRGLGQGFLRATRELVTLIAREVRVRRDMRRLAEMDDTMLCDVGIARTEIERAVRIGRSWSGWEGGAPGRS
jgi:uncharacterized protein YjiS (DUF1127 family)